MKQELSQPAMIAIVAVAVLVIGGALWYFVNSATSFSAKSGTPPPPMSAPKGPPAPPAGGFPR